MTDEENYTRFRMNIQRGDGPDRRGDVTVELSQSHDEAEPHETQEQFEKRVYQAKVNLEDVLGL